MKNVIIQRGLICLSESEFHRVMAEVSALEKATAQLKLDLQESNNRVKFLEEHILTR